MLLAFLAWGAVLWNGAGFLGMDDGSALAVTSVGFFRPLLMATYLANKVIGGWMLTSFLLHAAAGLLVFRLFERWWPAAIFAVHPLAGDAIASTSGRSSLLCALFMIATLVAIKEGKYIWATLAGVLAFASKEEAIALVILIPVALVILSRVQLKIAAAAMGIGVALCASLEAPRVIESGWARPMLEQGVVPQDPIEHARSFAAASGGYLIPRLFLPIHLSTDPEIRYSWQREAFGWLTLPLVIPTAIYAAAPLPDVLFEHRAYGSIVIAALLMGLALRKRPIAGAALLLLFVVLAQERALAYSNALVLWEQAAELAPNTGRPHINYGAFLAANRQPQSAKKQFELATRIAPHLNMGWHDLAYINLQLGDFQGASLAMDHRPDKRHKTR